jgi:hypothetical protein
VLSTERPDGHDGIKGDGGCTRASHLWSFSFAVLLMKKARDFSRAFFIFALSEGD